MPVGATIGVGVLGAGASILGSQTQAHAADKATQAQQQSSAQQLALLQQIYGQNTANETPYMNAGYGALAVQEQLLGLKPLTADQFNSGQWYQPGTVNYTPPATTTTGTGTGTGTGTTPPPASGYTGPSLNQILSGGTQGQMDAYLGYYQAHPNEDPGFTTISPFHGDPFVDESSAGSILAAHNAYLAAHPSGSTSGSTGGATGFPSTPSGTGTPAPTPAPVPAPTPTGSNPALLQIQAQQAIAAGADPTAVQAQMAHLSGAAPAPVPAPTPAPPTMGGGGGGYALRSGIGGQFQ